MREIKIDHYQAKDRFDCSPFIPYFAANWQIIFMKKLILSEKSLVVVLFVLVFIVFSLAQRDTQKIEKMYLESNSSATSFDKSAIQTPTEIPLAQLR